MSFFSRENAFSPFLFLFLAFFQSCIFVVSFL